MNARQRIANLLWWSVPSSTDEQAQERTKQLLDAYRAEVLTEAAALAEQFTERWPDADAMKADGIIGPFTAYGAVADELRQMATAGKDTRDGGQPPAGESTQPTPRFFQPGRTYTDTNGYRAPELVTYFRVEHITRHPQRGTLRAIGWMKSGTTGAPWHGHFQDEDQFDGWTEVSEDPANRFPYLGDAPTRAARVQASANKLRNLLGGGQ